MVSSRYNASNAIDLSGETFNYQFIKMPHKTANLKYIKKEKNALILDIFIKIWRLEVTLSIYNSKLNYYNSTRLKNSNCQNPDSIEPGPEIMKFQAWIRIRSAPLSSSSLFNRIFIP